MTLDSIAQVHVLLERLDGLALEGDDPIVAACIQIAPLQDQIGLPRIFGIPSRFTETYRSGQGANGLLKTAKLQRLLA